MNRKNICLATIDENAHTIAEKWGMCLEISEFCTAWNMDGEFGSVGPQVEAKLRHAPATVLHAPFNELFPCAIDPKARALAKERYLQAVDNRLVQSELNLLEREEQRVKNLSAKRVLTDPTPLTDS